MTAVVCLLLCIDSFGTAQIPDRLIFNGDTLFLYSNPLEDYYNENNPRPGSFGISGCYSTACWRGYQATWLIENNILYLVEIASCCMMEGNHHLPPSVLDSLSKVIPTEIVNKLRTKESSTSYWTNGFTKLLKKRLGKKDFYKYRKIIFQYSLKPKMTADLNVLFPTMVNDGRVRAQWFSGILRSPRGELLNYVHMGYMSTYEYELVFEVENGGIVDLKEHTNQKQGLQAGYGIIHATSYSMAVPLKLLDGKEYEYSLSDTLEYSDPNDQMFLACESRFNDRRLNPQMRRQKVNSTLDSMASNFESFKFENPIGDDMRWGTAAWVDGYDSNSKEFIRLFTIVNINGQMIVTFRCRLRHEEFYNISQNIIHSTRLMEFGF